MNLSQRSSLLWTYVNNYGSQHGVRLLKKDKPRLGMLLDEELHFRTTSLKFLLSPDGQALVFDTSWGSLTLAVSKIYDKIICVHHDLHCLRIIKKRLEENEVSGVSFVNASTLGNYPFSIGSMSTVILQDFDRFITGNVNLANTVLTEIKILLSPQSALYFILRNRLNYKNLYTLISKNEITRPTLSLADIHKSLSLSHLPLVVTYAIDFCGHKMTDFWKIGRKYPPSSFDFGGIFAQIKTLIKKKLIGDRFWPAYLISAGSRQKLTILDELFLRIKEKGGISSDLVIKRYYIPSTGTKVIIHVGVSSKPDLIIRISLLDDAETIIDVHAEALRQVSVLNGEMKAPVLLYDATCYGSRYVVEEKIEGVSVVSGIRRLDDLFDNAANKLFKFNLETKKDRIWDRQFFNNYVLDKIDTFSEYFPQEEKAVLSGIFKAIERNLVGRVLPVVWEHGDFKIENIIVSRKEFTVQAVIDWDYFCKQGIFLFDFFRLVSSYYQLKYDISSDGAFRKFILLQRFDGVIKEWFDKFITTLGGNSRMAQLLSVMYWIRLKNRTLSINSVSYKQIRQLSIVVHSIAHAIL